MDVRYWPFLSFLVSLFQISLKYLHYCYSYEQKPEFVSKWDSLYFLLNKWILSLVSYAKIACYSVLYYFLKFPQGVWNHPVYNMYIIYNCVCFFFFLCLSVFELLTETKFFWKYSRVKILLLNHRIVFLYKNCELKKTNTLCFIIFFSKYALRLSHLQNFVRK